MPVRLVGDDNLQTPAEPARNRRGPLIAILAVLVVALLVAVIALIRPNSTTTASSPAPAASSTNPATVDNTPPEFAGQTGWVDGAPGLWRGTATVTTGNSGQVLRFPVGWAQTIDGAVGAAINDVAQMWSIENYKPSTSAECDDRLLAKESRRKLGSTAEMWSKAKAWWGLNEEGFPVDDNGQVVPEETLYLAGFPRYAAYLVDAAAEDLSEVTVRVWMPSVDGVGSVDDLSNVRVQTHINVVTLVWEDGDWRIKDNQAPSPASRGEQTNLPWAKVREILGPGWLVPADGTDQPYEGAVLTQ